METLHLLSVWLVCLLLLFAPLSPTSDGEEDEGGLQRGSVLYQLWVRRLQTAPPVHSSSAPTSESGTEDGPVIPAQTMSEHQNPDVTVGDYTAPPTLGTSQDQPAASGTDSKTVYRTTVRQRFFSKNVKTEKVTPVPPKNNSDSGSSQPNTTQSNSETDLSRNTSSFAENINVTNCSDYTESTNESWVDPNDSVWEDSSNQTRTDNESLSLNVTDSDIQQNISGYQELHHPRCGSRTSSNSTVSVMESDSASSEDEVGRAENGTNSETGTFSSNSSAKENGQNSTLQETFHPRQQTSTEQTMTLNPEPEVVLSEGPTPLVPSDTKATGDPRAKTLVKDQSESKLPQANADQVETPITQGSSVVSPSRTLNLSHQDQLTSTQNGQIPEASSTARPDLQGQVFHAENDATTVPVQNSSSVAANASSQQTPLLQPPIPEGTTSAQSEQMSREDTSFVQSKHTSFQEDVTSVQSELLSGEQTPDQEQPGNSPTSQTTTSGYMYPTTEFDPFSNRGGPFLRKPNAYDFLMMGQIATVKKTEAQREFTESNLEASAMICAMFNKDFCRLSIGGRCC